ncbi:hypothetical protein F9278_29675 [Streptomyces phaeolivaceus]|uniref:Uncharacterized protein n=1 Tax=Streptomyces phaeolivaceus TaxID=2653200 RepID=A0A5P8K9Y4_9ACTN|nr:hypothetical protein [Streptomyces phaeolivaceus]QFQ99632.1 hypothetical protein F9278_29675 [Streptomyces phaeolivaceus]
MPPVRRRTARSLRMEAQERLHGMLQSQLEIARHHAEGWRNFLATATALLAAVLVLKGRENVAELTSGYRLGVVLAMAAGLLALLTSAFAAASAAHGRPGAALTRADGARLLKWEATETRRVAKLINCARWLAVAGVLATATGVMVTWLAPAADKEAMSVTVHTRDGSVCGKLVELDDKGVTLQLKSGGASGKDSKDTLRRFDWGSQAVSASTGAAC